MEPRKSFLLRVNSDLWKDIEAWAQQDLRSVNGQIEFLLRQAVLRRKGTSTPASQADASPEPPAPPPPSPPQAVEPPPPPASGPDDLDLDRQD